MSETKTKNKLTNVVFFVGKVVVTGAIVFVLSWHIKGILKNYGTVLVKGKATKLTRMIPSFEHFAKVLEKKEAVDQEKFEGYANYFENVVKYIPQRADAFCLLGFCYYSLGKERGATEAYKEAMAINPHFFWPYYNLGVKAFQNARYEEAVEILSKAVALRPEMTLTYIFSSKVYSPILTLIPDYSKKMETRLERGYYRSYQMLVLSCFLLRDFSRSFIYANYALSQNFEPRDFFYYYAGIAAYELKEFERASVLFKTCIEINPARSEAVSFLGRSLKELGEEDLSARVLSQVEGFVRKEGSSLLEGERSGFEPEIY